MEPLSSSNPPPLRHVSVDKRLQHPKLLFAIPVAAFLLTASTRADDVVFKSDVALTRVDAQVVDSTGRPITGLQKSDFVVRVNGHVQPIQNFASENMPIDILLLLDVSGSMEPHVERIASASREALRVLAPQDRIAIMVFDTSTRVRLPFTNDRDDITSGLRHVLRSEGFDRGTRITSAMLSACRYLERTARPEARRAVIILTDDETQDEEDETSVESALARANAVLSFLQADYDVPTMAGGGSGRPHGTWGGGGGGVGFPGGGGWPGGGGGWPGGHGGGFPGGPMGGDPSHSAGTRTIAEDSGGDTFPVDDASALRDTLQRLRQRYALYFALPEGTQAGDRQSVRIELSQEAKLRYLDAEIHYRRVFMSGSAKEHAGPTEVTHAADPIGPDEPSRPSVDNSVSATPRSHTAVNEDESGPTVNSIGDPDDSATPKCSSTPSTTVPLKPATTPPPAKGGWPKAPSSSTGH